jgi:ribosomal protein S18 acetylase RimI-like enzyme
MQIRYATITDAQILARIGGETFWDAYQSSSRLEQEFIKAHIAKIFTIEQINAEIEQQNIIYLIAENETEEIGYARLLVGSFRDEISARLPLEISRIYLRKKFWGKKLGKILLEKCFAEAEKQGCDLIWLSVWKFNPRAIKFYEKFGFEKVGEHIFDLAGSSQPDLIMQKGLEITEKKVENREL